MRIRSDTRDPLDCRGNGNRVWRGLSGWVDFLGGKEKRVVSGIINGSFIRKFLRNSSHRCLCDSRRGREVETDLGSRVSTVIERSS